MHKPIFFALTFALAISGTALLSGQDGDAQDLEQKIQRAFGNILDDEIQGEFNDVLDKLSRRIEKEMSGLLEDKQIQNLAEAIEKGDLQGVLKQVDIKPSFSVGLHLRKVDEDGQKQIKVVSVVKGSPAEKAGIKVGDVIRSINDREIDAIGDLVDVVKNSKGRELKFRLLRDAMAEIVRVKPAMQVAGIPIGAGEAKHVEMLLRAMQGEMPQDALGVLGEIKDIEKMFGAWMRKLDAPVEAPKAIPKRASRSFDQLPDNVSLSVIKSGKEPAKIMISRDDQVWEVNELEIDELPVELQPYVRHALGIPQGERIKDAATKKREEFNEIQQQLKRLKAEMEALKKSLKDK